MCTRHPHEHYNFLDTIDHSWRHRKHLANVRAITLQIPSVMCWGCSMMLYKIPVQRGSESWVTVSKDDRSPAVSAYPRHAHSVQVKSSLVLESHDMDVRVCGNCKGLDTRSKEANGPGLARCRLFLDICGVDSDGFPLPIQTPAELAGVCGDFELKKKLSLVDIKFMTPSRKGKPNSYSHLRGNVKKVRSEFTGVLGLLIGGSEDTALTPAQKDHLTRAVDYLCESNHLFGGLKTSLERGGYSFPMVGSQHCNLELRDATCNSQQTRVGSDRGGIFVSVDDMESFSHQVPLDSIVIGSRETRPPDDCDDAPARIYDVTYGDVQLEGQIFPCEYHKGRGFYHPSMYKDDRANTMSPSHYIHARLKSPISMWRENTAWRNFMFDWVEKRNIHEAQAVMIKMGDPTHSGQPLTAREADLAFTTATSDLKRNFVPSSVSGSASHMKKKFLDLCALCSRDGMAHLFLTLTADEDAWPDIKERCGGKSACVVPVEVAEQMDRRFAALMADMRKGLIFGKIKNVFVKLEYQGRGALHYHILIWLEDTTDLCRHVSAVIPPSGIRVPGKTPEEKEHKQKTYDELRSRVLKYNIHTHNSHCLEYYGSEQVKKTMVDVRDRLVRAQKDLIRGFSDDKERYSAEEYVADRLVELSDLEAEYEQVKADEELQDKEEASGGRPDGALPRGVRCKQGFPFSSVDQCYVNPKDERWVYTRRENPGEVLDDSMVIEYNPKVVLAWDGGTNCKLVSNSFMCEYLLKYVAKTEPVFDLSLLHDVPEHMKEYLKTEEGKHVYGRLVSSVEVAARLFGQPHVKLSENVLFLPTDIPESRTRVLDRQKVKDWAAADAARRPSEMVTADADVGDTTQHNTTVFRHRLLLCVESWTLLESHIVKPLLVCFHVRERPSAGAGVVVVVVGGVGFRTAPAGAVAEAGAAGAGAGAGAGKWVEAWGGVRGLPSLPPPLPPPSLLLVRQESLESQRMRLKNSSSMASWKSTNNVRWSVRAIHTPLTSSGMSSLPSPRQYPRI